MNRFSHASPFPPCALPEFLSTLFSAGTIVRRASSLKRTTSVSPQHLALIGKRFCCALHAYMLMTEHFHLYSVMKYEIHEQNNRDPLR
jgi:hypothetical protein